MAEFYKQRRWNATGFIREWHPIPDAPLYVLSNDARMSALGSAAGKCEKNVCVIPCYSQEEANAVYNYVLTRKDQSYVRINGSPPRNRAEVLYSLQLDWIPRALERLTRGNREDIVAGHHERVRGLTDEEREQGFQVSINAHHTCEVCFFCICRTTGHEGCSHYMYIKGVGDDSGEYVPGICACDLTILTENWARPQDCPHNDSRG